MEKTDFIQYFCATNNFFIDGDLGRALSDIYDEGFFANVVNAFYP